MPTAHPAWRPRVDPAVDWVAIDGEIVAIDGRDRLHLIAGTGALVWPFLDGETSLGELAEDVADVFRIEVSSALADLTVFVSSLDESGLTAGPPHT